MTITTTRHDYDNITEWSLADCRYWFWAYGWGLVISNEQDYAEYYDDDDYIGYLRDSIEDIVAYFGCATYADGRRTIT